MIQGYPPPILIAYRQPDVEGKKNEKEEVSSTEAFLKAALDAMEYVKSPSAEEGRRGQEDQENIVLFLGRNQWVQMPAEVTVRRFLQHKEVCGRRLAREYGFSNSAGAEGSIERAVNGGDGKEGTNLGKRKKYALGVLFPASRRKPCAKGDRRCNLGIKGRNDTTGSGSSGRKKKEYPDEVDQRHDVLPELTLPRDIYGTFPDADSTIPTRYTRPQSLGGGSFIGSAEDVERLFKGTLERTHWLKSDEGDGNGASKGGDNEYVDELTYLFSEMFIEQEIESKRLQELDSISRQNSGEIMRKKRQWTGPMMEKRGQKNWLLDWFAHVIGGKGHSPTSTTDSSQQQQQKDKANKVHEYEFGISLDYESRTFQDMADDMSEDSRDNDKSSISVQITNDIRYLSYDVPNLVRSPCQSTAHLFRQPLMLPPELLHPFSPNGVSSPFGLNSVIYNNLDTILEEARKVKVIPSAEEIDQQNLRDQGRKTKRQEQIVEGNDADTNEQPKEEGEDNIKQLGKTMRISWSSLEFATNIAVPRGSISSVLDMARFGGGPVPAGAEELEREKVDEESKSSEQLEAAQGILDEYWGRMWFNQKKTRQPPPPQNQQDKHQKSDDDDSKEKTGTGTEMVTVPAKYGLLSEYNKPGPFIYALESESWGGELNNWWNVRGGRGGFWTDQGT